MKLIVSIFILVVDLAGLVMTTCAFSLVGHRPGGGPNNVWPVPSAPPNQRTLLDGSVLLLVGKSNPTRLFSSATNDYNRVKLVGGGIPVNPAGSLFDPSTNGRIASCWDRIATAYDYSLAEEEEEEEEVPEFIPDVLDEAENFLEHVTGEAFAKNSQPVDAVALGRISLISPQAPGDIQHILLQLPPGMHYLEGQSISVFPPGIDVTTGKPHRPRLYSISSTRYGELLDGNTLSLCVRRAEYVDPHTGRVDPSKKGICSNFLCDLAPGTKVQVAGPTGKSMLLPEGIERGESPDLILVATGTGIAPFRAFLRRLFSENTVARHMYNGQVWLILGVPVSGGLLYAEEFEEMKQEYPEQFDVTYAISREMKNRQGGKLYVQDILTENISSVLQRLDGGAHIYFCGLKGMMPGILDALESVTTQRGLAWKDYLANLKKNGQWHVEVY